MLDLVTTHLCPESARGGLPLQKLAGLPGGGAAAGGERGEVFAWRAGEPDLALSVAAPKGLRMLMDLVPLSHDLLVACYQGGLVGLSLADGSQTTPLLTDNWTTARPWPGQEGAVVVLGDKNEVVIWSARSGEVIKRLPLRVPGSKKGEGFWLIVLATAETLVLMKAPQWGPNSGLVILDIPTGQVRAAYDGEAGKGLGSILWLGGARFATVEGEGSWRVWVDDLSLIKHFEVEGRSLGGPWLGVDVVMDSLGGHQVGFVDVAKGERSRPMRLKDYSAGIDGGGGVFAAWRSSPPYRPLRGKGVLYAGSCGPKWRIKKLTLPRAPRYAMSPTPGTMALLPFEAQEIMLVKVEPLEMIGAVPIAAPVLGCSSTGAEEQPDQLLGHTFTMGLRASKPGFGQGEGADLLLLHEGSVGRYRLS